MVIIRGVRTYRNRIGTRGVRLASHVGKEPGNLVLVDLIELRVAPLPRVQNVFAEKFLGNLAFFLLRRLALHLRPRLLLLRGQRQTLALLVDAIALLVDQVAVLVDQPALGIALRAARVRAVVRFHDELGQPFILTGLHGVADHAEDVEPRQNRLRQLHVVRE